MPRTDERPACRLEFVDSPSSAWCVILRRGPSMNVCCILWNRADDTFNDGQWLSGRIHAHKSCLSPDGRYFIYSAIDPRPHRQYSRWTAISRPPFLTALALWPHRTTWVGGGRFIGPKLYVLFQGPGRAARDVIGKASELIDVSHWNDAAFEALEAENPQQALPEELAISRYSVGGGVLYRGTDARTRAPIRDFNAMEPTPLVAPYDDRTRPDFDVSAIGDW